MEAICPSCGLHLVAPDRAAGGKVQCPCGATFDLVRASSGAKTAPLVFPDKLTQGYRAKRPAPAPLPGESAGGDPRQPVPRPSRFAVKTTASVSEPRYSIPTSNPTPEVPPLAPGKEWVCPGCFTNWPEKIVLCTSCGYDKRFGKRVPGMALMEDASPLTPPAQEQERIVDHRRYRGRLGLIKFLADKGVAGGVVLIIASALWFFFRLNHGWINFVAIILFIVGLVIFIRGAMTGNLAGKD